MELSDEKLKKVIKALLLELLAENRALFYEIVKEIIIEVFENEGMKNAMAEVEDEEEKKDEDNQFFSLKRFLHRKNIYRKFP